MFATPLGGILLLLGIVDGGSSFFGVRPPPLEDLPILRLIGAYLGGGAASGIVLGAAWPGAASRWSAAAVGYVSAIPFFLAVRIAVLGPFGWSVGQIFGLGIRSLLGVFVGLILWWAMNGRRRRGLERRENFGD